MKFTALTALSIALALIISACGSSSDSGGSTESSDAKSNNLYVQNALQGEFSKGSDGEYQLKMHEVESSTLFFADRPSRRAGTEPTSQVVSRVVNSDDPPNGAIVWQAEGAGQTLIAELLHGKYSKADATLNYRLRLLDDADGALAEADFEPSASPPTGQTGPVSLYIDSGSGLECKVNFVNDSTTDLVYGDVTMEIGSTLISSPEVFAAGDGNYLKPSGPNGEMKTYLGGPSAQSNGTANQFPAGTTSETFDFGWTEFAIGCSGTIRIGNGSTNVEGEMKSLVTYNFDNPDVGSDSSSVSCAGNLKCTKTNHSHHTLLSDTVTISGGSD